MPKQRIDDLLVARGFAANRKQAQAMLMAGEVLVAGQRITTGGTKVDDAAEIVAKPKQPYVSRGGYKLVAALDAFGVDPAGRICADVGASTGGFTDVLLQRGAAKVYAIDVGYGDLAWKLRNDARVVVMERTNARYLKSLPEPVSLVVVDASFISLKTLLPAIKKWLAPHAEIITLIKPQFEAPKNAVGEGGVVREKSAHRAVLQAILAWVQNNGFTPRGLVVSPITGPAGNREFLLHITAEITGHPPINTLIERCLDTVEYPPSN